MPAAPTAHISASATTDDLCKGRRENNIGGTMLDDAARKSLAVADMAI
jgi:hypothetical protein